MSRIGIKPILLPEQVDASLEGRCVVVKGPCGQLSVSLPPHTLVSIQRDLRVMMVAVEHPDYVRERALWGLTRQLIQNAVDGVQKKFEKSLEFVGVGFKVVLDGKTLVMDLGFSHKVRHELPAGIEAKIDKQIVTLCSIDKYLVGETAASIRHHRPPEPYKGKGIKYVQEVIRRKAGKTAKTSTS